MSTPTSPLGIPDDEEIVIPSASVRMLRLRLNDDLFLFARKIPLDMLAAAVNLRTAGITARNLHPFWDFFQLVMPAESYERLHARGSNIENPVDHNDLMAILHTLIERWGLRPTLPSPSSPGSFGDGMSGTTSTPGASSTDSAPSATSPAVVL